MLASWIVIAAIVGILVHEAGHLLAARILRVQVIGVRIGFGPEIFARTDRSGTRWRLGLIPVGGSCSFFERAAKSGTGRRGLLDLQPIERAAIFAAGPLANLIFAAVLLLVIHIDGTSVSTFEITSVQAFILLVGGFSLLLGLFNLIPVPPLDGGRLVLIAIAATFGWQISSQTEYSVFAVGTAALSSASFVFSVVVLRNLL